MSGAAAHLQLSASRCRATKLARRRDRPTPHFSLVTRAVHGPGQREVKAKGKPLELPNVGG